MSLRGPRCGKHPSHVLVGVCAFCLKERLAGLADVECASEAIHTHNGRKKKQSPGRPLAVHGSHRQSSEKRGGDWLLSNVSVEPIVNKGLQDDSISCTSSSSRTHGAASKGLDKSVVVENMAHATTAKKANNLPVNRTSPKPSTTVAHEPSISAQSPKPNKPSIIFDMSRDGSASMEMPLRHSFSSTKRPSFTMIDCSKLPPPDIKMPILENDKHTPTESKSKMLIQKHTSVACTSPLVCIPEQAKLISSVNQVHHAASDAESERKSFNAARRSLPLPEPATDNVKDEEITLFDASPNAKYKKKTLSSLFSLDDAEFPSSKAKAEEAKSRQNVEGEAKFNGSTSTMAQQNLHVKTMQRRCKHGSFSERVEPGTYLFPVPETANSKPLSWFSSLFRRRKKKSHPKSVVALASFSEHNNGWENARQSWEAPRPSSWEQFRFSSFEGPRSSWEPARPSWEGVMRTSDGESVFSGFDFLTESLGDVREEGLLAQRNQQELAAVDSMNALSRSLDSKRLGSKSKPLAINMSHMDDKDRGHSFLPIKATLMQRDVSTQTTPPRASDATELFIQQRLQRSQHHRGQQYAKASHAVWSKVWTKTFSNSKWAFKQKHQKDRRAKDMGDAMVPVEEGNVTSGRSSFHEGTNRASNHHPKLTCVDNIEEHEAWDTFYSPLQQGRDATESLASKGNMCVQKDEPVGKVRGSNLAIENGLLKFYLTPVRGHGKSKQGIYGI